MKFTKLLYAVALLFIALACQEQAEVAEVLEAGKSPAEKIAAARAFFEREIAPNSYTANAREAKSRKNIKKILKWEKASIKELSVGESIKVPIEYEENYYTPVSSDFLWSLNDGSYALIYKDAKGKEVLEVVTVIPNTNPATDPYGFSGLVFVEDWKGGFIKGFQYAEGELSFIEKPDAPREGDINEGSLGGCLTEVTDWYTCSSVTINGEVWDLGCEYSYSEYDTNCEYIIVYDNPSPGGGSGGGGSSGGSGSSGDYDPTGDLLGDGDSIEDTEEKCGLGMIYHTGLDKCVPICGPGYELDELGKCVSIGDWELDQTFGRLCDDIVFYHSNTSNSYKAQVVDLGGTFYNVDYKYEINVLLGVNCIDIPEYTVMGPYDAAWSFSQIFNNARTQIEHELESGLLAANATAARSRLIKIITMSLKEKYPGATFGLGECQGSIPISIANYGC